MGLPRIVRIAETASTNKDAMRLGLSGEALPLWVVAERQTAGRGRAGRDWISLPGNLHASVVFRLAVSSQCAGQLALVAGLAFHDAVKMVTGLAEKRRLRLKWPNDLLIGGAKAGGILVESTVAPGEAALLAVVGFGLNISSAPEDLGRSVTSLSQECLAGTREEVLEALVVQNEKWMDIWNNGLGFAVVRGAWTDRAGEVGEAISINTGSGPVSGTYRGLSETGALLAEVGGKLQTFTFGDVALANGAA